MIDEMNDEEDDAEVGTSGAVGSKKGISVIDVSIVLYELRHRKRQRR